MTTARIDYVRGMTEEEWLRFRIRLTEPGSQPRALQLLAAIDPSQQ